MLKQKLHGHTSHTQHKKPNKRVKQKQHAAKTPPHITAQRAYLPDPLASARPQSQSLPSTASPGAHRYGRVPAAQATPPTTLPQQNNDHDDPTADILSNMRRLNPSYHDYTDGEHPPNFDHAAHNRSKTHMGDGKEDLEALRSIDMYNHWLGNKLSHPIAQAFQTLLISAGLSDLPENITADQDAVKQFIVQTLTDHGVLLADKENNPIRKLLERNDPELTKHFRAKFDQKQQHVITLLDHMVKLKIIPAKQLSTYQVGCINPDIPYRPGRFKTNNFSYRDEINPLFPPEPELDEHGNPKPQRPLQRVQVTVIDAMLDCLRLAGAFDIKYMDLDGLQDAVANPTVKRKQYHPPPQNEHHLVQFTNTTLLLSDPKLTADHPAVVSTNSWFKRVVHANQNLTQLLQILDLHSRHDVVFKFRTKFDAQYKKIMSWKQRIDAQRQQFGNLPEFEALKHDLTPQEMKLLKSLIYDCYLQKSFAQHYLFTVDDDESAVDPLGENQQFKFPINKHILNNMDTSRHVLYNIQVDNLVHMKEMQAQKDLKDRQHEKDIQNALKKHVLSNLSEYPTVALQSALTADLPVLSEAEVIQRQQKILQLGQQTRRTLMFVPPEANYQAAALVKFVKTLAKDGIVKEEVKEYDTIVDMKDLVLKTLVEDLKMFEYKPENENDEKKVKKFMFWADEGDFVASDEDDNDNTNKMNENTNNNDDDGDGDNENSNSNQQDDAATTTTTNAGSDTQQNDNTNKKNKNKNKKNRTRVAVETEEFEIIDILVEMGVISHHDRHNFQPRTTTPLIVATDNPKMKSFKRFLLQQQGPANTLSNTILKSLMGSQKEVYDEDVLRDDVQHRASIDITPHSTHLLLTKPVVLTPQNARHHSYVLDKTSGTPIWNHPFIRPVGYARSPESDAEVNKEIAVFDQMLANITDCTQLRTFMLQFFRHDVVMDFALTNPALFTKFIGMDKSLQHLQEGEKANMHEYFLQNDNYSDADLMELRWLCSKLHVQYQLSQQYKMEQLLAEYDPQTHAPEGVLEFLHVSVGGVTDKAKELYINQLFKNDYVAKKM